MTETPGSYVARMRRAPRRSLLLDEEPLIILPGLAVDIGLNEAIILQQLNYWLQKPGAHSRDGRQWVYNTYADWHAQFPFLSVRTIQRTILHLEELGFVISTDKYNQHTVDKTKWYAIDYERFYGPENDDSRHANEAPPTRQIGTSSAPTRHHVEHAKLAPSRPETTEKTTEKEDSELRSGAPDDSRETKQAKKTKATKEPNPALEEAKAIIAVHEELTGVKTSNYGMAMRIVKPLVVAGFTAQEVPEMYRWLENQKWTGGVVDIRLLSSQLDKWRILKKGSAAKVEDEWAGIQAKVADNDRRMKMIGWGDPHQEPDKSRPDWERRDWTVYENGEKSGFYGRLVRG